MGFVATPVEEGGRRGREGRAAVKSTCLAKLHSCPWRKRKRRGKRRTIRRQGG